MNFNQAEWFCSAFELRSFAKAAAKTYVSRQAFGKAIKSMETELGTTLFFRGETGVVPTKAAEVIYPIARRCVNDYHGILRICDDYALEEREELHISMADGMVESLPDDFFDRMETANPRAHIVIGKHFYTTCLDQLHSGQVNFAICPGPVHADWLHAVPLVREKIFIAAAKELISFDPAHCTLHDLQNLPFFSVGEGDLGSLGLQALFAQHGMTPITLDQYTEYGIILGKVRKGHGAALVPESVLGRVADTDLLVFPFPDNLLRWEVDFLYRDENLSDAERGVVRFMESRSCR